MIEAEISRNRFLKILAKLVAIFWIGSHTTGCKGNLNTPPLKGISEEDYHAFRGIQRLFLEGNPVSDFDLGLSLDQYIYGHPYPIETEDLIRFLATVPSSYLIAMVFDFSFTPLSQLDRDKMEKRILSWKTSGLAMKRGLYSILRQISFFLLTSDKRFQQYMGYYA